MQTQAPTAGDFDGDGHHDLAVVRSDYHSLLVLYGPFSRGGEATRTAQYESPLAYDGEIDRLVADSIDGDRATDLVVHAMSDGEQSSCVLLTAGPDGLSRTGRALREGNAIAFGDFNGDGTRDVAVGDNGSRNNEPGYETEEPDVSQTVTVFAKGTDASTSRPIKIPNMWRELAAADTNGDGTDELAVSLRSGGAELLTIGSGNSHTVTRAAPSRVDGRKVPGNERAAKLYGAVDADHDGKDEVVLAWGRGVGFALYGEDADRWWITEGAHDQVAFTSKPFAGGAQRDS
ncbi:FG-GAP repeat protein [Streptomyces sp. 8N616]|uniref:FG-GAP repeat protein n=1 Tax=Streptomyces sp. 8N616 TaxID=3457414 RepID=UPI003FD23AC1